MKLQVIGKNFSKEATPRFRIDDVVNVTHYGCIYPTYENAFKYFNIDKLNPLNYLKGTLDIRFKPFFKNFAPCGKTKWRIVECAIHENGKDILYLLVTHHRIAIVIGEDGIQ